MPSLSAPVQLFQLLVRASHLCNATEQLLPRGLGVSRDAHDELVDLPFFLGKLMQGVVPGSFGVLKLRLEVGDVLVCCGQVFLGELKLIFELFELARVYRWG